MAKFFLYFFASLILPLSVAMADSGLANLCRSQAKSCTPQSSMLLVQASRTCEIESTSLKCETSIKENPDLKSRFKKCDQATLCKQELEFEDQKYTACLRGYKNALVDTGIALKDMAVDLGGIIEESWEGLKKGPGESGKFCASNMTCKKELAGMYAGFGGFSDNQFKKRTAKEEAALLADKKAYEAALAEFRAKNKKFSNDGLNDEQRYKLSAMANLVQAKLKKEYQKYRCYSSLAQIEMACYAVGNVVDPTILAGVAFKGVRLAGAVSKMARAKKAAVAVKVVEVETAGAVVAVAENVSRPAFIHKYLHYNPTTVKQNEEWIAVAEKGVSSKAVFIDIENSQMKFLNDTLKDKNLVTSLTNYHKSLVIKKIEALKKEFPGLKVSEYSDFKSLRFAFDGKVPKDLQLRLNKIFQSANDEFTSYLVRNNIIRRSDKSEAWFRAGIGGSAEQANLAARYSRQTENNVLHSYTNKDLQSVMGAKVQAIENERVKLRNSLANTSMVDGNTFDDDVFDIVRKNVGDTAGTAKALSNRYGLSHISNETVASLQRYVKATDEFSPGLFIAKRENANLNDAVRGGFSADIIGLGASNMKGTAEALAKSKNVDSAIHEARAAEKSVTVQVNAQKSYFQEIVKRSVEPGKLKTVCSGDDCVAVATKPLNASEKQKILDGIADSQYSAKFRFAFVNDGVKSAEVRNILSTHGEAAEKILRKSLGSMMEPRKLQGLTFGLDMQTEQLNQGAIKLIIGKAPGVNLSASEKTLIQNKFREAVQELNASLTRDGKASHYQIVP
ncbi:MAG: hypothetical protein ACM3MG_10845 [Bacillota bacterium]